MTAVLDTDSLDIDVLTDAEYQECLRLGFTICNTNIPMVFRNYKEGTSRILASKAELKGLDTPVIIISYIESTAVLAKVDFKLGLQTMIYAFDESSGLLNAVRFFGHTDEIVWSDLPDIKEPGPDDASKAVGNNLYALRNLEYVGGWELSKGDIRGARADGMIFKDRMHDIKITGIKVSHLNNGSSLIAVTVYGLVDGTYNERGTEKSVVNNYYRQFYYVFDARTRNFDKCMLTLKTDKPIGKLKTLPRFSSNWVLFRVMINKSYIKVHEDVKKIGDLSDGLHMKLLGDRRKYTLYPESILGILTDADKSYWGSI